MLVFKDVLREFNPHHPEGDAFIQKVDCKPLNGLATLIFVFRFRSDDSRIFIALGGPWDAEIIGKAKSLVNKTVRRCLTNPRRTQFELLTKADTSQKGQPGEIAFSLQGISSHCLSCPETRLIDNVQPTLD